MAKENYKTQMVRKSFMVNLKMTKETVMEKNSSKSKKFLTVNLKMAKEAAMERNTTIVNRFLQVTF